MEELIAGIVVLLLTALLTLAICIYEKDDAINCMAVCVFVFSSFGSLLISDYRCEKFHRNTPKAIEVYQGKTTLEITYRDSVAVDSVVVYKK